MNEAKAAPLLTIYEYWSLQALHWFGSVYR